MNGSQFTRGPRIVRFGTFQIDLDSRELFKNGRKVRLSEQPFQLLTVLLERPGEVVSRESLRSRLWPGDIYVDFDHSLNTAASKLRDALGDSAENPVFIQTLHKRGYRFAAPVVRTDHEPVEPEARNSAEPQPSQHESVPRILPWLLTAAALLLGALLYSQLSPPRKIQRVYSITSDGRAKTPELATDGARVFFSEWHEQHWTPAHVPVAGGYTELIPTPFIGMQSHACVRGISPDKSHLLVVTGQQRITWAGYAMWEVTPSGSAGRRLGDLVANDGSWSPDGSRFAWVTNNQIWIGQADGREARKIAEVGIGVNEPRWSPDGKRIRFTAYLSRPLDRSILEISATGGSPRKVLPDWDGEHWGGAWTPGGEYFVFNSGSNLWALPERAQLMRSKPQQLTFGPISFYSPLPSLDGKRLFAVGELKRSELFRYDMTTRQFVPVLPGISATQVAYSRDGEWVVYVSYPEGELWRSRSDGSNRQQLTRSPLIVAGPRWSPDGRRIAVLARNPLKPWKLYTLPAQGGALEELSAPDAGPTFPDWSPDGTRIVVSHRGPSQGGLAAFEVQTAKLSRIPGSAGLGIPRWSPDGRYISAWKQDTTSIMILDVRQSSWTEIAGPPSGCGWTSWSPDSAGFFCIEGKGEAIHHFDMKAGKLQKIVDLSAFRPMGLDSGIWLGITPDGSPLVAKDAGTHEIYALEW